MGNVDIIILVLSLLDCACCLVCRIPQIWRLYKLKESQAISIPYWIFNMISCVLCITAYSLKLFVLSDISMVIFLCSATINMLLNTLTLILVKKYRKA
ncbi:MAG: hypothetical protein K6G38_05520 [Gammaproteobacteria bacterium]|nr:hypothetical protein [Gammaproteobacteria bacterium]